MMKSSHIHFSFKKALTGVSGLVGGANFTLPPKYYALKTKSYNPQDAYDQLTPSTSTRPI